MEKNLFINYSLNCFCFIIGSTNKSAILSEFELILPCLLIAGRLTLELLSEFNLLDAKESVLFSDTEDFFTTVFSIIILSFGLLISKNIFLGSTDLLVDVKVFTVSVFVGLEITPFNFLEEP